MSEAKTYSVLVSPAAWRELMKLPQAQQERILTAIESLEMAPRPSGSKKLEDGTDYRLRVGDYRVIYSVEDAVLRVLIVKVGHRREVYR